VTSLILKLNRGIKKPVLTVGLNGHSKGSPSVVSDFVDLHQALPRKHKHGKLMEIDIAKGQFTPAGEAYIKEARKQKPLTPGEPQRLPPSSSYVVFDDVSIRIELTPPEEFSGGRYLILPEGELTDADKKLSALVRKYHDDTATLVALNSYVGYLFHLAALDVPDIAPELQAPAASADEESLALMGRISRAEVLNRLQKRIDTFPGSEKEKQVLRNARYWVTEMLQDKAERFQKVNRLTSDINRTVSAYLSDGRALNNKVADFFKL
jgi:hypothetical protein